MATSTDGRVTLLERLRLPAATEGLAQLPTVLRDGAKSHYGNPALRHLSTTRYLPDLIGGPLVGTSECLLEGRSLDDRHGR